MTKLCYPAVETWFICWDENRIEIKAYGSITPEQCLETAWNQVDYYIVESEWLTILLENGIDPYLKNKEN